MERILKTYNVTTKSLNDSIITTFKRDGEPGTFEYRCNDILIIVQGDYPFMALADIRAQLYEKGLILMCLGARIDVYPSGMSLGTFLAYKTTMGRSAGKREDLVHILNPTEDIEMIGSLKQQKEYRKKWLDSIGAR